MNQIFGRDTIHLTQTPKEIDNSDLYEQIGNIVIERAHAGDKGCEDIYARAWQKTKESLN